MAGVLVPYTRHLFQALVSRFLNGPLQFELRPSFTDELTLNYYGMGNASSAAPPPRPVRQRTSSTRATSTQELVADVRFKILDHFA